MSAIGQPAVGSGERMRLSGFKIAAVSAMKCTPQNTTTGASIPDAFRASSSESPVKSAMSCTSGLW